MQFSLIVCVLFRMIVAKVTWQNILITADYSSMAMDPVKLTSLQASINLAIQYLQDLIQVRTHNYQYNFSDGTLCDNINVPVNTSYSNLLLIITMNDDVQGFVQGQSCIQNNLNAPIVATLRVSNNYVMVDINHETQLIISEITRILSFEPQYLSSQITYASENGTTLLISTHLQALLASFLACPTQKGLQLSQLGYTGDPQQSLSSRIYIDSSILGNVMWSQNQLAFKQLMLTNVHQTIFEKSGQYKFTRDIKEGGMGKNQGCGSIIYSRGCDTTNQFKTQCDEGNDLRDENCVSFTQIVTCYDPSMYSIYPLYVASGESFGPQSICMASDLWSSNETNIDPPKLKARCLKTKCLNDSYQIIIPDEIPQNCTSDNPELTQFQNYNGGIKCLPQAVVCGQLTQLACLNDCNNNGVCMEGSCYCSNGFYGSFCQFIINTLTINETNSTYISTNNCDQSLNQDNYQCNWDCDMCDEGQNGSICLTTNYTCLQCSNGYFLDTDNQICAPCLSQCQTCSSRERCTSCKNNLAGSLCSCAEPGNWTDLVEYGCTEQNLTCKNQFLTDQKSFICLPAFQQDCSRYQSYALNDIYAPLCQSCIIGYYLNLYQLKCLQCSTSCITCDGQSNNCTNKPCGLNQMLINRNCQCDPGYLFKPDDNQICTKCNQFCSLCIFTNHNECIQCNNGYYIQSFDLTCKVCPTGCLQCRQSSFPNENQVSCSQCQIGYDQIGLKCYTNATQPQISCSNGYYSQSDITGQQKCRPCPKNCTSCGINDQIAILCYTCDGGFRIQNARCADNCLDNQYYSTTQKQCLSCDMGCLNCYLDSGMQRSQCSLCAPTYSLQKGICRCNIYVVKQLEMCNESDQYDPNNQTCGQCTINCKACIYDVVVQHSICLTCTSLQVLSIGMCKPLPLDLQCSNLTTQLYDQFNGRFYCMNCMQGCTSCQSLNNYQSTQCITCESDYTMVNGVCQRSNILSCNKTQTVAYQNGIYSCAECPSNCQQCFMQYTDIICTTCANDYQINLLGLCASLDALCRADQMTYTVPQVICKDCSINCGVEQCYQQNPNNTYEKPMCRICMEGYTLTQNFQSCVQCAFGQINNDGTCYTILTAICPMGSVEDATGECICGDSLVWDISRGQCLQEPQIVCYDPLCSVCTGPVPFNCQQCVAGYYLDKNYQCQSCSNACDKCQSQQYCTSCQPGYFLISNGELVSSCSITCPQGYLPLVNSLYQLNPEIFPIAERMNFSVYGYSLQEKAIAIGSEGTTISDANRVPFDTKASIFIAYYSSIAVRAQCIICISDCSECPPGMLLTSNFQCVYRVSCKTQQLIVGGYYICTQGLSSVHGTSLDPKGYQSIQQDLILSIKDLDPTTNHTISWQLTTLFDGSLLNTNMVYENHIVPGSSQLSPSLILQIQNDLSSIILNQPCSDQLMIPFPKLKSPLIYHFNITIDGNSNDIYIPVVNILQTSPLTQILNEVDFQVYPLIGHAMNDTFTVFYNALEKQAILQQCGINGALFMLSISEAMNQNDVESQLSSWKLSSFSNASQSSYSFIVPYTLQSTFLAAQLIVQCGDYQFIGFRKFYVIAQPFDVQQLNKLQGIIEQSNNSIDTIINVGYSLFNFWNQLNPSNLIKSNTTKQQKLSQQNSSQQNTSQSNSSQSDQSQLNSTQSNSSSNGSRRLQLSNSSTNISDNQDQLIQFKLINTMNVLNLPFDFSQTCPPDGTCQGRGDCLQSNNTYFCQCITGLMGINCELTIPVFDQFINISQTIYNALINQTQTNSNQIMNQIHMLQLLTSIGVFNNESFASSMKLLGVLEQQVYNQESASMMYVTVSNQAAILQMVNFTSFKKLKYYLVFSKTIQNLNYLISSKLRQNQMQQLIFGGIYINSQHVQTQGDGSIFISIQNSSVSFSASSLNQYRDAIMTIASIPSAIYTGTPSILHGNVLQLKLYTMQANQLIGINIDTKVNIIMPLQSSYNASDYSLKHLQLRCKWLNHKTRKFSSDGCITTFLVDQVLCQCINLQSYALIVGKSATNGSAVEDDSLDDELSDDETQNQQTESQQSNVTIYYESFPTSAAFFLMIILLSLYIIQMMIGFWFDKQQEENFILRDITEVELRGRLLTVKSWLMAIFTLRNPWVTLQYFHITSPRPLRFMYSLSKVMFILTICSFLKVNGRLSNLIGLLAINILVIWPLTVSLQLLRNYTSRSRRLAYVGYLITGLINITCIVVIVMKGIQLETYAKQLNLWGEMAFLMFIYEVLLMDSIRALVYLKIYRSIVENGESSLEGFVDQQELRQFYRKNTNANYQNNSKQGANGFNTQGFKIMADSRIIPQNDIDTLPIQIQPAHILSQDNNTINQQERLPWEHQESPLKQPSDVSSSEYVEDGIDNQKTADWHLQNKDL